VPPSLTYLGTELKRPISRGEIKGRGKRIKGKTREHIGKLANKKSWQLRGRFEQTEGEVGEVIARIQRKAKNLF